MTVHFPYSGTGFLFNLCDKRAEGSVSYNKENVTCERCLAALRSREGTAAPGCLAAPTSAAQAAPPEPLPQTPAALESYVRLAVLAERERIAAKLESMPPLAYTDYWMTCVGQQLRALYLAAVRSGE